MFDFKRFRFGIAATAVATMIITGATLSHVVEANGTLGFGITSEEMTIDTGDTTAPTTIKPPPAVLKINTISGIIWEDPNNPSIDGPTFTFTSAAIESLMASGINPFGSSLSIQYTGMLTSDTSMVPFAPLEKTAALENSCIQPQTGAAVGCADALGVSPRPTDVPEPTSLAVLGSALLGFGLLRHRAQADQRSFGRAVDAR